VRSIGSIRAVGAELARDRGGGGGHGLHLVERLFSRTGGRVRAPLGDRFHRAAAMSLKGFTVRIMIARTWRAATMPSHVDA